jgi:uncharacterized paraquat-inducible protein A
VTIPRSVLIAIGKAVQNAGGDMTDVEDLVQTWERLARDRYGRVDQMRHAARTVCCCCGRSAEPAEDGRCSRCFGRLG